jgi:hypothetical protein
LHSVAAAALGLSGARLRLITPPDSGGSFGVKAGVYAAVVLTGSENGRAPRSSASLRSARAAGRSTPSTERRIPRRLVRGRIDRAHAQPLDVGRSPAP